ncbi:MAG: OmpA family protein [Pseudomonadota bacterium]
MSVMRVAARTFAAAIVLFSSSALYADDETYGGPNVGQAYIVPGIGYLQAPDDFGSEDESVGLTGIIGFPMTDRFLAEVMIGSYEFDFDLNGQTGTDDANSFWLNGLWKFMPQRGAWQPFATVGVGRTDFEFEGVADDIDDDQANLGVGVFGALSPRFSLRADVRGVYSEEAGSFSPFVFMGLSAILGPVDKAAPADTDGDGVPDRNDDCPGTLAGRDVGPDGCELDSDGDGVVDGDDMCPDTPAGVEVDSRGCPPDADTDGDGVADKDDDCPNTPAGVEVNRNGCALDSDGDGVPNYKDQCPNSEAGALVDENGCYVVLEEDVTIDMSIEFDTNSADIRSSEIPEIRDAVTFLRQFPAANAVIEGHTDDTGAESYNQQLSERRAQSVYNYLINQAGIPAARLTYVGYGESRPISSNDTNEGRQRNRRVSAVLSATREVRAQ